jgi:hypothetical protein
LSQHRDRSHTSPSHAICARVDEVVTDHDERSLTSSLPPLPDPRSAARALYDAVAGFGPVDYVDGQTVGVNGGGHDAAQRRRLRRLRWAGR